MSLQNGCLEADLFLFALIGLKEKEDPPEERGPEGPQVPHGMMLVDAGEDPTKAAIWKGSRAKKGLDTLDEAPEFLLRSYSFGIRHFFPFWLDPQM